MISEEARHQLYSRLGEVLGNAEASTLMGYLPPLGWGDVATKDDVRESTGRLEERLEQRIDLRFSQLETQIASVQTSVHHQNRSLFMAMLTLQFTAFGLFVAAAHLT